MPEKKDQQESLGFLEKSHCVPILIALDKNGMMNRNQIYSELGETIRIVIKRIQLLKDYGLIYEIEMGIRPFAKLIDLTIKGKNVARHLSEIEEEMAKDNVYPISLFHFSEPYMPDDDYFDKALAIRASYKHDKKKALSDLHDISECPQCSSTLHILNEKDPTWTCFKCGFKKGATLDEMAKLWALEHIMNRSEGTNSDKK